MTAIAYVPGGNKPFGNLNTNPEASAYKPVSGYTPTESILIRKAIKNAIFDAAPEQYNALKLLYAKPFEEVNLDEFEFLEFTFGRSPVVANGAGAAAVPAVPGSAVSQVIPVTAASLAAISTDLILTYPDGVSKANIRVIGATTITVESPTSGALPQVLSGDMFSIQSTIRADGMLDFSNYERPDTVTRYNFVQWFLRAARWDRIELQKYENAGTTNYLVVEKEHKMKQIRVDLFNSLFNGLRGEFRLAGGKIAKSMGGIYPSMLAAGSMSANPTISGFQAAFETLAFATNFKAEGGTRFVYGTDEMLHNFSKIYKQPGLRYQPDNEIAKLGLKQIDIGTMKFVLVPTQLFQEPSCFSADWRKKILVIDQETVQPVKMKGLPEMGMGETLDRKEGAGGTRESFKDFWVEAQLSLRFNNPLSSFIIQMQ